MTWWFWFCERSIFMRRDLFWSVFLSDNSNYVKTSCFTFSDSHSVQRLSARHCASKNFLWSSDFMQITTVLDDSVQIGLDDQKTTCFESNNTYRFETLITLWKIMQTSEEKTSIKRTTFFANNRGYINRNKICPTSWFSQRSNHDRKWQIY